MKQLDYTDPDGYRYRVLIPEGSPASHAHMGVRVGPPDLATLNLPSHIERRLNNELFSRGLITVADVRRRPGDVQAAVMAAMKADAQTVMALYERPS